MAFIDIDGVLAARNTPAFLARCNTRLKLSIEPERLTGLSYQAFLNQPELYAFRERYGEKKFDLVLRAMALEPDYLRELLPFPKSLAGVQALAEWSSLSYCSARKTNFTALLDQRIEQATVDWLVYYQFSSSEQNSVLLCHSPLEKLHHCIEVARESGQQIILVDDLYERLLQDAYSLDDLLHATLLRSTCTLVAFGAQDISSRFLDQCCPFKQVLALPTWDVISNIVESLISLEVFERTQLHEQHSNSSSFEAR